MIEILQIVPGIRAVNPKSGMKTLLLIRLLPRISFFMRIAARCTIPGEMVFEGHRGGLASAPA
jgi:hypothetical protein